MTLAEIKIKIGERIDDDTGTAYAARYEGVFVAAMCELIRATDKEGNYLFSASEYPELTKPYNFEANFSNSWCKKDFSDISNLMYIRDVFTDPELSIVTNIIQKREFAELQHIANNPILAPAGNEVFWGVKGNSIFLLSGTNKELRLSVDIILNPNPTTWETADLNTDKHYGRAFIEECIKQSANILKAEIGLE